MVKPDGVARGLIGEVLSRIERKGLKIAALKMIRVSRDAAEKLYAVHRGKPFFEKLIDHVTSGPVVVAVVEGRNAVEAVRTLIGDTCSYKAKPGSIRGDFGLDVTMNIVHAADSEAVAGRELSIFFNDDEIFNYSRGCERWI